MPNDKKLIKPFNPLDKRNLGESVANALIETQIQPLPPMPFVGAGVYAIYFTRISGLAAPLTMAG